MFKDLAQRVTGKIGRQVLVAQKHSPTMLVVAGAVGVVSTAILAGRATLKMSEVLEQGEDHLKKVEVTLTEDDHEIKKASFGVKLQVAIKIAKLYAPTVIVGVATVGALTGSHVIMRRRNAALGAAYAVVHKSFGEYRGRVIEDQGKEKDLEYRFGTVEREIVEEGPNGPETRVIKGPDAEAIKQSADWTYARIFDRENENWSTVPNQNQYFLQMVENNCNRMLRTNGFLFLNDVYDQLGMKRSKPGQVVGWALSPKINPETGQDMSDGYVDFGYFKEGMYQGKEFATGNKDAYLLDFNVDGNVLEILDEV